MNADYNSLESVVSLIVQSGLNKFKITRPNSPKNSIPVYESINTNSNADAVSKFKSWADLIENTNPYEMLLFDSIDAANTDDVKGKKKIVRFTFTLNGGYRNNTPVTISGNSNNNVDQSTLIKQIVAEMQANQKEDRLSKLEQKIDSILNGDDEDDEDQYQPFDVNGLVLGVNTIINNIKGIKNQNTPAAALNGPEEQNMQGGKRKLTDEQTKRLMDALNVLKDIDPEIDQNIYKLALIAQKKPDMYKMAIQYLNSITV